MGEICSRRPALAAASERTEAVLPEVASPGAIKIGLATGANLGGVEGVGEFRNLGLLRTLCKSENVLHLTKLVRGTGTLLCTGTLMVAGLLLSTTTCEREDTVFTETGFLL